jgi:hypothetical protein
LTEWQEEIAADEPKALLRGLIHSDGCRCINRVNGSEYLRYFFDNNSCDIRGIFCDACDRLDIAWTWSRWQTISVARASSVALLDEFVGPKA